MERREFEEDKERISVQVKEGRMKNWKEEKLKIRDGEDEYD